MHNFKALKTWGQIDFSTISITQSITQAIRRLMHPFSLPAACGCCLVQETSHFPWRVRKYNWRRPISQSGGCIRALGWFRALGRTGWRGMESGRCRCPFPEMPTRSRRAAGCGNRSTPKCCPARNDNRRRRGSGGWSLQVCHKQRRNERKSNSQAYLESGNKTKEKY